MYLFLNEIDSLLMNNNAEEKQIEERKADNACICARTDKRTMEKSENK